jgi:fructose-1,6-bisphosphatase I
MDAAPARGWTQMTGQLRLDGHLQRYSETAPHALAVAAAVDAIAAAAI